MRLHRFASLLLLSLASLPAFAAMQSKPVEWSVGSDRFSGVLVYDDATRAKRPGLAMVPDWLGVTPEAIAKAKQQAGRDYVILVVDMYGKGVRPKNGNEARAEVMKLYSAPEMLRARIGKAIDVLKGQAKVAPLDASRLGAFGFCMGGKTVLELARAGTHPELKGVVALHGGLDAAKPAVATITTPILVLNGGEDQGEMKKVDAFQSEMRAAHADWTLVNFAGAEHCFALEGKNSDGCRYNARAAGRAFRMMRGFFDEMFGRAAR